MCCREFLKRVAPFFLTFAVGLFIASFFVSVAAPSFQFNNRNWKKNHRQYDRQREIEIQRLREENIRLKNQLSDKSLDSVEFQELKYPVPPPPPMPPAAPGVRMDNITPVAPHRIK
jgi:hypothetical protein